ncbi:MAG: ribosomal protein S18-alanine N-acetyltransferase [Sinobacteraceae bacterium]|nr:ribosomal protein S18-alanine N-acetyltransferase [Nevskiaceae bacterium]
MSAQPQPSHRLLPMNAGHLPQVLAIERQAYAFPWTEGIFRDCLRAGYSGWVLCDENDTVLGYALMSLAVDEAHVLNLCVDPACQRQGLGRFMLEHLMKLARASNATIVLLEVRKSNKAAIRLYESCGFQRIGLRRGYYPAEGGREDALVLGLDIV